MEKEKKYVYRKNKAVKGLGISILGAVGTLLTGEAALANGSQEVTISKVDIEKLTEEEKSKIKYGAINEKMSWTNQEGNIEWITEFVLVYQTTGKCEIVETPKGKLPATGEIPTKALTGLGYGILGLGGYLLFKNRKNGKTAAIAVLVAGGLSLSTPALANSQQFLETIEKININLNTTYTSQPESNKCWEYVGYYPKTTTKVPSEPGIIIPEQPKETPKTPVVETKELDPIIETGKVIVKFKDETGKTIAPEKELISTIVSTTQRTETITDGISSVSEKKIETNTNYDATGLRPETIDFEDERYTYIQVEGEVTGTVKAGTTEITYIYKKLDPIVETVTKEITGKVITKYINEQTGEELVGETPIVEGVVTNEITKTTKTGTGKITNTETTTEATGLEYDTTADKKTKDAIIAGMRTAPVEVINPQTGETSTIDNAVVQVLKIDIPVQNNETDTTAVAKAIAEKNGYGTVEVVKVGTREVVVGEKHSYYVNEMVRSNGEVGTTHIPKGQTYYIHEYKYEQKGNAGNQQVPYEYVRVDKSETGAVVEGVTVITYYYKPVSLSVIPTTNYVGITYSETTVMATISM